MVLHTHDFRSAYYPIWLTTLALPAAFLPRLQAAWLAIGSSVAMFAVAVLGGPSPGRLGPISAETLAIHVSLPFFLVGSLAYAADALRRLQDERTERERLAIEAERQRIAWDLHDSAKQRLHAAHLLVSSLHGRVPEALDPAVERAIVELESASADMDTSLAELRSPLEGRPLDEALRERAAELEGANHTRISVRGRAPSLSPLVAAHAYRIGCEALTNALRHADASTIEVELEHSARRFRLRVRDDGRGMPPTHRPGATGLLAMRSRAATIDAQLAVAPTEGGPGTTVVLDVPLTTNRGEP
jgi:signal transduction histidine kinase